MDEQNFPLAAPELKTKVPGMARRRFLETGVWAATGMVGLTLLGIGGRFVVGDALQSDAAQWVDVGEVTSLPAGQMHQTVYNLRHKDAWRTVEEQGLLYVFSEDGVTYTVLSAICTHLGCNVHWEAQADQFHCPCHAAVFTKAGAVISGPPQRALRQLEAKIEAGKLLVLV